jgi:hypothetical protein
MFRPLFAALLDGGFAIRAGDPARAAVRKVAKEGAGTFDAAERGRLGLDRALPPSLEAALLDELVASHCGLMPKAAFGNMAVAQRYRDAHLAAALVAAASASASDSAVLLAGNGHVRSDRGVPFHLAKMAPGRSVVAIMLVEVEAGQSDVGHHVPRASDGRPAADFIVLTPRVQRADPCEEMRQRFRGKGRG